MAHKKRDRSKMELGYEVWRESHLSIKLFYTISYVGDNKIFKKSKHAFLL